MNSMNPDVDDVATSSAHSSFGGDCDRIQGLTIAKPIVYGNSARYLGKKSEEEGAHTHSWTVYVKPYLNEDMAPYVRKVQFKLHESYPEPIRTVFHPPYQITESGWGEFEIVIKIFFKDPDERSRVTLCHLLKLYRRGMEPVVDDLPVVSENYEEIVFQNPTQRMHVEEKKRRTLETLLTVRNKIRSEITDLKGKIEAAQEGMAVYRTQISRFEISKGMSKFKAFKANTQPRLLE